MLRKNIENFFAIIYEANSSANLNDSGSFDLDIYFLEIILGFILTVSIYTLPLVIYRFGIRKRPLTEYRAKRVTIVYAIIAFFVMTIIKGGATIPVLLLWSFLNYRLLIKKTKNDIDLKYDPKSKKSLKKMVSDEIESSIPIKSYNNESQRMVRKTEKVVIKKDLSNSIFEKGFKISLPEDRNEEKNIIEKKIQNTSAKIMFCRKCGTKLLSDSEFCHKCGARILR